MTLCWIIAQLFHHTFLHYNSLLSVHQLKENHTENHLHFQRTGTGVFSQSIFMQCRLQPLPHHHGHTEGASTPNVQSLIFRVFFVCLFVCLFLALQQRCLHCWSFLRANVHDCPRIHWECTEGTRWQSDMSQTACETQPLSLIVELKCDHSTREPIHDKVDARTDPTATVPAERFCFHLLLQLRCLSRTFKDPPLPPLQQPCSSVSNSRWQADRADACRDSSAPKWKIPGEVSLSNYIIGVPQRGPASTFAACLRSRGCTTHAAAQPK